MEKLKIAKILAGIAIVLTLLVIWSSWILQSVKLPSLNTSVYNFSVGNPTLTSVIFLIGIVLLLNSVAILLIKKE